MSSPFPGMDPYLEDPGVWPDVHTRLITGISEALGPRLRPQYFVRVEQRIYLSDENDPGRSVIVPDVRVIEKTGSGPWHPHEAVGVEVAEPIVATTLLDEEIREARLQVIDRESRQVITVIEVVSPTNKVAGARGRQSYEEKRHEVMNGGTHFVEIDLLRRGRRFTAREAIPECEYLAHVSKVSMRPKGWIWPIRLSQRLPSIWIPLKPTDPDVSLDLQEVLDLAYDRAGYDMDTDYAREPDPALNPEWAAWSDRLLREKGLR